MWLAQWKHHADQSKSNSRGALTVFDEFCLTKAQLDQKNEELESCAADEHPALQDDIRRLASKCLSLRSKLPPDAVFTTEAAEASRQKKMTILLQQAMNLAQERHNRQSLVDKYSVPACGWDNNGM